MSEPRILLFDIENSAPLGWAWKKYQTDLVAIKEDFFLLSFAWKWLGEARSHVLALPDFQSYAKRPHDDRELVHELWKLLDEADIVVGHNSHAHDVAKAKSRFSVHDFPQMRPFKEVDTYLAARRYFNFTSNSLDTLCRVLGIGEKMGNDGFKTWRGCMEGTPKAWKLMKKYNRHDVDPLLEGLYLRLRPWIENHPNLSALGEDPTVCPKCGEGPLIHRGWRYASVTKRQAFECKACGGYSVGRKIERLDALYA